MGAVIMHLSRQALGLQADVFQEALFMPSLLSFTNFISFTSLLSLPRWPGLDFEDVPWPVG
jgi:hypothetical protein